MAIPLGTTKLNPAEDVYRRHGSGCTRYKDPNHRPPTYRPDPQDKKAIKADTCNCTIWCDGYLAKETRLVGDELKPKRVNISLVCTTWVDADKVIAGMVLRGRVSEDEPAETGPDKITMKYAVESHLETQRHRRDHSNIVADTYDHVETLLRERLLPWCELNEVVYIKAFELKETCQKFYESWRSLKGDGTKILSNDFRTITLQRFRTFLKECMGNTWIKINGAKLIKTEKGTRKKIRRGLSLAEFEQMKAVRFLSSRHPVLTQQEKDETWAATVLMRWCGLRVSDAHEFDDSKIQMNANRNGKNAVFMMKKSKYTKQCISPMPKFVEDLLNALPGRMEDGKKRFFTCEYSALRERVIALAKRAQNIKPFADPIFSPHRLRHTFAIQHILAGSDIRLISGWLGHESVDITLKHYANAIAEMNKQAEDVSKEAVDKMLAKIAALELEPTNSVG